MPSVRTLKALDAVHRVLLKASRGRLGWKVAGMPALELVTIGRKTGRRHSVMLTSPVQEDGTLVLVASRGGNDHHPSWFLNLRDNPEVEVVFQGEPKRLMKARVAGQEERARLWPLVTAAYQGYGGYQASTSREIPVILLDPLDPLDAV